MQIPIFDKDRNHKICPNGASINYPAGTLIKVPVGGDLCKQCPLWVGEINHKVTCSYTTKA